MTRRIDPTDENLAAVLAVVERGESMRVAAKAVRVGIGTLYTWVRRDPAFCSALERARDAAPSKVKAPKAKAPAAKPKKPAPVCRLRQDRRPVLADDDVAAALAAGVNAIHEATADKKLNASFGGHKLALPPSWPALRSQYHAMADAPRRAALLALLLDEGARLERDSAASWLGRAANSNARQGSASR